MAIQTPASSRSRVLVTCPGPTLTPKGSQGEDKSDRPVGPALPTEDRRVRKSSRQPARDQMWGQLGYPRPCRGQVHALKLQTPFPLPPATGPNHCRPPEV